MFKFFSSIATIFILIPTVWGQSENQLLHPSFFDYYIDFQILPEGTIRMLTKSDQNNGWVSPGLIYTDFPRGQSLEMSEPVMIIEPEIWSPYSITDVFDLRLQDGSMLLAYNFLDCDVNGPGGVFMLNSDGIIDWFIDYEEGQFGGEFQQMAFVDSNSFYVGMENGFLIIDKSGNIIQGDEPSFIYMHSVETTFGFLAGISDNLDLLDNHFEIFKSYFLDGDIVSIHPMGDDSYFIRTNAKYYILKSNLLLESLPILPEAYITVWPSKNYYWAVPLSQDLVVQFDTFFTVVDTHFLPNGIIPIFGVSSGDDLLCMNAYENHLSDGIVTYKGIEGIMDFHLHQDIGITKIQIPDSVVVEDLILPWTGQIWIYHYKTALVDITNFGTDTVFNFYIQGHDVSECYAWCTFEWPFWEVDSLVIPPGVTFTVRLDSFTINCVKLEHNSLCLSTVAPNQKADGKFLNDMHCETFAVIVNASTPVPLNSLFLKPNPANDYLLIDIPLDYNRAFSGTIVNANGTWMENLRLTGGQHEINTIHYPNGIYFLNGQFANGEAVFKKFIVIH